MIDSAADAHEQRGQRSAESEADQHLHRVLLIDQEDDRGAQQSQTDGEHARDAAGFECEFHRILEAGQRGIGAAHVALDREPHPDEARAVGRADAHQEGDRDAERQPQVVVDVAIHEEQGDEDDQRRRSHGADLAPQVGHRAFFDRVGHVGHRLGAGVGGEHDADQIESVGKRDQGRDKDEPQDQHLPAGQSWQNNIWLHSFNPNLLIMRVIRSGRVSIR